MLALDLQCQVCLELPQDQLLAPWYGDLEGGYLSFFIVFFFLFSDLIQPRQVLNALCS